METQRPMSHHGWYNSQKGCRLGRTENRRKQHHGRQGTEYSILCINTLPDQESASYHIHEKMVHRFFVTFATHQVGAYNFAEV